MEKQYILILSDTDNEICSLSRVLEYATNVLKANPLEALDLGGNDLAKKVFENLNLSKEADEEFGDILHSEFFFQDKTEAGDISEQVLSHIALNPIKTLEEAKEVLHVFDEDAKEASFSASSLKFNFLECYAYSHLETVVESLREVFDEVDIRDIHDEVVVIGEMLTTISVDNETIASFVLSGATGNGYVMRNVFLLAKYSVDGQNHS